MAEACPDTGRAGESATRMRAPDSHGVQGEAGGNAALTSRPPKGKEIQGRENESSQTTSTAAGLYRSSGNRGFRNGANGIGFGAGATLNGRASGHGDQPAAGLSGETGCPPQAGADRRYRPPPQQAAQ